MAQKEVTYQSSSYLNCANCVPANVILCLPASLVAPKLCADDVTEQTYEYRQIEARILSVCRSTSCGSASTYTYTIDYNEDVVTADLESRDIQGIFCKGCLTNYIEDLAGNEITVEENSGTVTITSQHGCAYSFSLTTLTDLLPALDCTYDIGSALARWKDLYLCGDMTIDGEIIMTASVIRTNTVDGADTHEITITGGGAADLTRGALLTLRGNEAVSGPGRAVLQASTGIDLQCGTGGTSFLNSTGNRMWIVSDNGTLNQDTSGSDIVFNLAAGIIRHDSADADDKSIILAGGGTTSALRGSSVQVYGTAHVSTPGGLILQGGNNASGHIDVAIGNASALFRVLNSGSGVTWSINNSGQLVQNAATGSDIVLNNTNAVIRQGTVDGADSNAITVAGGGAIGANRGAHIHLCGNEHANTGQIFLDAGGVVGGKILLRTTTTEAIEFYTNLLLRWSVSSSGQLVQNVTNGSDIIFNVAQGRISQGTSDGADTKELQIAGGGGPSVLRGSYINLYGNEHATQPGHLLLIAGSVAGGSIKVLTGGSIIRWSFNDLGQIVQDGTNGSDLIFNVAAGVIRQGTADAADTNSLTLAGGGAVDAIRGSYITVHGNESAGLGAVDIFAGGVSTGLINLYPTGDLNRRIAFDGVTDSDLRIKFGDTSTASQALIIHPFEDGSVRNRTVNFWAGNAGSTGQTAILQIQSVVAGGDLDLYPASGGDIHLFKSNGAEGWTLLGASGALSQGSAASDIIFNTTVGQIRQGTSDAADTSILRLAGGGTAGNTRGSWLQVSGNESGNPGLLSLEAGNVAGGKITLKTIAAEAIEFSIANALAWSIDASANILQASGGGDIVFAKTNGVIRSNTSDATDNKNVFLVGGGSNSVDGSRGAYLWVHGNESSSFATNGNFILASGNATGSQGYIFLQSSTTNLNIVNASGTTTWKLEGSAAGDIAGNQTSNLIKTTTADASDNATLSLAGGGTNASTRGAYLDLHGNEHANLGGFRLAAGLVNSATSYINCGNALGTLSFIYNDNNANVIWSIPVVNGHFTQGVNGGDVVLTNASTSVRQTVVTGITAAGTVSGDATALTGVINNVTTVAAATGVRLWAAGTGSVIHVRNGGANALNVFPDTGGTINGGGVDAAVSVAVGAIATLTKVAALTWIASEAPAA